MSSRFDEDEEQAVLDVVRSGVFSPYFRNPKGGPKVQEFEEAFAKYLGVDHAIAVSNGTAALHLALKAVGVTGELVDTTVASFIASSTSVLAAGGTPVWHDIDPETYCLYPGSEGLETANRVLPVDLLGVPADYDALREAAPSAIFIEDAAQALGTTYQDRKCGTLGDIATFSFQETKTITTGGEGGLIATNNEVWAAKVRQLRNHGSQYSDSDFLCYNFRMTELQAAVGLAQLKKLGGFLELQAANAGYIRDHLPRGIHFPRTPAYARPNWYIIGCTFDEVQAGMTRAEFLHELEVRGVDKKLPGRTVGPGYQLLIPQRPLFATKGGYWPVAEELKKTWLWMDIHRWRPLSEVKADVDVMQEILK